MNAAPLYGLILAGGESRRMGQDKGALAYHGTSQTQHLAALLAPLAEEVYVSVRAGQLGEAHLAGLKTIIDYYPAPTPLNGIVSAMRHKPGASWLVIAVDMPYVTGKAIATLISARNPGAIATCFESPAKGGPDPLFAIWEDHGFVQLEPLIKDTQEHVCPRSVLKRIGAHVLKDAVMAEVLMNVNTPEEWRSLQKESA